MTSTALSGDNVSRQAEPQELTALTRREAWTGYLFATRALLGLLVTRLSRTQAFSFCCTTTHKQSNYAPQIFGNAPSLVYYFPQSEKTSSTLFPQTRQVPLARRMRTVEKRN